MSDYDDFFDEEPEPRYKTGDTVHLLKGFHSGYVFEQQNNEDGPRNGDTITGPPVSDQNPLTVVSRDWEGGGYVYNLEHRDEPEWRVWSVPEHELRKF